MEQSEKIFERNQELKIQIELARKNRIKLLSDPEVTSAVSRMINAQHILESGDPHLLELQGQVAELRKRLYQPEKELSAELKTGTKELHDITKPAIEKAIERLSREHGPIKVDKQVLERTSGGFSFTPRVILETNEDAVWKVRVTIADAEKSLRDMGGESISKIEGFLEETLAKIRKIDLKPVRKQADEFENARVDFLSSPK
jgi:hypothetical protein